MDQRRAGGAVMMSAADPVTQDRVYRALKGEYLSGAYRAGTRLDLQGIADRLRASKTPVREAIHRLVGERLIESDPTGGFRICVMPPAALIQLYTWNAHLLISLAHLLKVSSLQRMLERVAVTEASLDPEQIASRTSRIFSALAEEVGNAEAVAAIAGLNERLWCTRIAEVTDREEAARELKIMTNAAVSDIHKSVRRRLEAYHERRIGRQRALIEPPDAVS